jgi:hypothetical protein
MVGTIRRRVEKADAEPINKRKLLGRIDETNGGSRNGCTAPESHVITPACCLVCQRYHSQKNYGSYCYFFGKKLRDNCGGYKPREKKRKPATDDIVLDRPPAKESSRVKAMISYFNRQDRAMAIKNGGDEMRMGFPDVSAIWAGHAVFIEAKRDDGSPTFAQLLWLDKLRAAGAAAFIAKNVEDCKNGLKLYRLL